MKHIQLNPIKSRAAIQGFGNVAQYAALGFTEHLGGKIVCVSYWDRGDRTPYTVFKDTGIDVRFLISITDIYGCIDKDKASVAGYRIEDADSWIRKDVDVLIPAALEGQINEFTVHEISDKVKIIAEGANGSTTPEADAVLKGTDIMLIPDFLCNAGGLVCSYLEEIQSTTQHWWRKNKVLSEVDQMMTEAFGDLIASAEREQLYYRDAAYLVAIERVVRAMHERGIV